MAPEVLSESSIYSLAHQLYSKHFGRNADSIEPLTAHGSDRIILRMLSNGGNNSIAIINQRIDENRAFIYFGNHFRKFGLNTPEIYCSSDDEISYLMQDLGNTTLLNRITKNGKVNFGEEEKKLYKRVIEILPEFQVRAGRSADFSYCCQFNEFGEENIRFDLNYFYERFLKQFYRSEIHENDLNKDFDMLKHKLLELERTNFLYRDFQSRNIMNTGSDLYFIDFQSGRRGALLYDIASLLYDAKAEIPQPERELLAEHYLNVIQTYTDIDKNKYSEYFWYFAMIRIFQAMGAYGFLGIVKRKKRFLESIPLAIINIRFILENKIDTKQFPYLKRIFSEIQYEKT